LGLRAGRIFTRISPDGAKSEMDFSSLRQILAMRAECFARG